MYWFRRPPYLRWSAAAAVFLVAAWLDLRPAPTVDHPFAAADIPAGTEVEPSMFEWEEIPKGILAPVAIEGRLLVDVEAGAPLVGPMLAAAPPVPDGWWVVELPVPQGAVPGDPALVVIQQEDGPVMVEGVVVSASGGSAWDAGDGAVAVGGDMAGLVAAARWADRVTVLVAPH